MKYSEVFKKTWGFGLAFFIWGLILKVWGYIILAFMLGMYRYKESLEPQCIAAVQE